MAQRATRSCARTTDPEEVLADPDIDVVSVASYDDAHFEQIRAALAPRQARVRREAARPARDEARELAALLRANPRLRLSTNVPLRLSPRFQRVRAAIAAGELGRLFHLEGDYEYGRRHKLTDGWRGADPDYSVVLGGAIHMVDLLLWLSGLRVTEVLGRRAGRGSPRAAPRSATTTS